MTARAALWRALSAEIPAALRARQNFEREIAAAEPLFAMTPWGDANARDAASKLDAVKLKPYLDGEAARRKGLEDRAKTNLLGITLAFSVIFTGLSYLNAREVRSGLGAYPRALAAIVLVFAVLYLVLGGMMALRALRPGAVYQLSPEDEAFDTGPELAERMLYYLRQNQRRANITAAAVESSTSGIRNGVLLLAVLVLGLGVRAAAGTVAPEPAPQQQPTTVICAALTGPAVGSATNASCIAPWPWYGFAQPIWITLTPSPPTAQPRDVRRGRTKQR